MMLPRLYRAPSVWPYRLRWLGLAVCGVRGHKRLVRSLGMVDGREVGVYCGRCRTLLYTASAYGSTG